MSSTALQPDIAPAEPPFRSGFNPAVCGLVADCDGGGPIAGSHLAGRQAFRGTLTGHYREFGPYRWRWYLLSELTRKPGAYPHEAVWCEAESLAARGAGDLILEENLYSAE